jgi:DNA-binding PadR family transcriptional regulator
MSRLYKPADFSALLEKYADSPLFSRNASNIDREISNSTPSRHDIMRARLSSRFRTAYRDRSRTYALRDSEIFTLTELGTFRVIATEDLSRFAYDGNQARLEQDLQSLRKQGLISQREIEARNQPKFHVLSLTKDGKRFLEHHNRVPKSQALYAGFVKSKELAHDAELYRLYQKVTSEIERSGGVVRRVVLDSTVH